MAEIANLTAHYKMNDNSNDSSGNGNDGTDSIISYQAGKLDDAARFTDDSVINVPTDTANENIFDNGGTFCAWFYATAINGGGQSKFYTKGNFAFYMALQEESAGFSKIVIYYASSGTDGWYITTSASLPMDEWAHVFITYDTVAKTTPVIYVNNSSVAVTVNQAMTGTRNNDNTGDLRIGNANTSTTEEFIGDMDDFRLYKRTLTSDERDFIYNSGDGTESNDLSTGTNMQINIGDSWKAVDALQINIGNAWKEVVSVQQNIGDSWKTVY